MLSSMIQHLGKDYIDPNEVEIRDRLAYCLHVDEEPDVKPWYYDIKRFLKARKYPENATNGQKRALRRLANHFFYNREVLYKRTPDLGLLRCVDAAKATKLLEEIHAGMRGPYMNGFTLAWKILEPDTFGWPWKVTTSAMCKTVTSVRFTGILSRVGPMN
uniref:Uncharacterized protein LOC104232469 n=1 Tax=Nicotiana sylvestris TaxID=4096 RepID=A0A1U7X2V0_NICSY|nr:PREDICTED: uncharacterized protein LOC104232469 [Nicotiana sylvestris]